MNHQLCWHTLKRDLIPIALNLQSTIVEKNNNYNKFLDAMRNFNDNFNKLHSELAVFKLVTNEPTKQIVTLERKCRANAQYCKKMFGSSWNTLPSGQQTVATKVTFNF